MLKMSQNREYFNAKWLLKMYGGVCLSASADLGLWIHARVFVCPCVRPSVTLYLEIRASDFFENWYKVAS